MSKPVIVSNGSHEVRIYSVMNRGRRVFQISYYEGGMRQRRTLSSLSDARVEANFTLNRLSLARHDLAELSMADMESYAIAKRHLEPTGVPIHLSAETFAKAQALLGNASLLDAARFYRKFHNRNVDRKSMRQLVDEFARARQNAGVTRDYVVNIRCQFEKLLTAFPGRPLVEYRTQELDEWLSSQSWSPSSKNNVRKIFIAFGNWAKRNSRLPQDRPTEFDGMNIFKEPATKVAIYTPQELRDLLLLVESKRPALLPWLACAAFTGARVAELDKLDWKNINFSRGFVEVASEKVRTKSRRLVPLHDSLKRWLEPYIRDSGPINLYAAPQTVLSKATASAGIALKANGLRHSYISYRLAVINDTARVALEAGNSPDVIFRHYRELVGPEDGESWFNTQRTESAP